MPVPRQYQFASMEFTQFRNDARDAAGLTSTNAAYTMAQGVLLTFRRRLDAKQGLRFATTLPAVLRAILSPIGISTSRGPFDDRSAMTKEVQALRPNHNYSPDTAIRNVATALRKHVDAEIFDRVLTQLLPGATEFWRVD